jgi:hypothetical protein
MGALKLQTQINNYNMFITQCDLQHLYGEYVESYIGQLICCLKSSSCILVMSKVLACS